MSRDQDFDRNVDRLLNEAHEPVVADPMFRARLREQLLGEAAKLRRELDATSTRPGRFQAWTRAAAAALLGAAIIWGVEESARPVPPVAAPGEAQLLAAGMRRLPSDVPAVVSVPRHARGLVEFGHVVTAELRDGVSVSYEPGFPAVLSVEDGYTRIQTKQPVIVRVNDVEVHASASADCEIESDTSGGMSMSKQWLIPSGAFIAGGAIVAVLMHAGQVDVTSPSDSRPTTLAAIEKPLIITKPETRPADSTAAELAAERTLRAQAERKLAELEKKLAAAKKDGEKLASELVQKKGVTVQSVMARISDLKLKSSLQALISPGKMADLVADLKGLGKDGTDAVLQLLKSEDAKDRFLAAKLLEDMGDPASIPGLLDQALKDTDEMAANMAGHALALLDQPGAVDALREIVDANRSWAAKVNGLWGLCKYGDQRGLEQTLAWINDTSGDATARATLGANIALLGNENVMSIIDATVAQFNGKKQIVTMAIEYYRQVATPLARERLRAIAQSSSYDAAVRKAAEDALR